MRKLSLLILVLLMGCSSVIGGLLLDSCCDTCECAATNGYITVDEAPLTLTSKSAFLMEANSGRVLFAKDADKQLPIASMVKITTLAVIYDALEAGEITLDEKIMVSRNASGMGGSQAFLDFDCEYVVDDLIKSIIIASANDSCVALAERIAGSETEFVDRMNTLAQKLGMVNTNYVNVTGLPAVGAYSTAADVAKIYAYTMKSPYYGRHELTWMYDLTHPCGRVTGLTNTNRHARFFDGVTGGKTGFTTEAGHCLAVSATRGDLKPIAVVIGAPDSKTRFAESGDMMNYIFGSYKNELIVSKETVMATAKIKNAFVDKVDLFARNDFFDLVKKGEKVKPVVQIEINEGIKAPFTNTDALGKVVVTRNGKAVAEVDLVAREDIDGLTYWTSVQKVISKFKIA
ncbi:MAG: D-alanyl-D-alanine carboxypeptidase [Firmicutes bacterium]|nr:D-alanyl-D-alanine carboxypeptidase [Bacillota bacterium]